MLINASSHSLPSSEDLRIPEEIDEADDDERTMNNSPVSHLSMRRREKVQRNRSVIHSHIEDE